MVIVVVSKEHLVLSLKPLLGEIGGGGEAGINAKARFLAQVEGLIGTGYPSDTYRHLAAQESTRA